MRRLSWRPGLFIRPRPAITVLCDHTKDAQAWKEVVLEGLLAENGMPNFADRTDAETAEAIRAYVISEANSDRGKAFYDEVSLPNSLKSE